MMRWELVEVVEVGGSSYEGRGGGLVESADGLASCNAGSCQGLLPLG